jgi:hypothetical protein
MQTVSTAVGPALAPYILVNQSTNFTVYIRDALGRLVLGEAPEMFSPQLIMEVAQPEIGVYTAYFTPATLGEITIFVGFNDNQQFPGSPFIVTGNLVFL